MVVFDLGKKLDLNKRISFVLEYLYKECLTLHIRNKLNKFCTGSERVLIQFWSDLI